MEVCTWKELANHKCDLNESNIFWQSIYVWILKPHILNKRISAVDVFDIGKHDSKCILSCYDYFKKKLPDYNGSSVNNINALIEDYRQQNLCNIAESNYNVFMRLLYPKSGECLVENIELFVEDKEKNIITFLNVLQISSDLLPLGFPYTIMFEENHISIFVPNEGINERCTKWLKLTLLPKLVRWMNPDFHRNPIYSNQLIPADQYVRTYYKIKKKYYESVSKIWTESTSPQKFIIEDIAIASYLLTLWGESPQKFVDLGCGNGLLVYILNSENHIGVGLDVRARKIWKSYPDYTVLKECTISPSLDCVFPEADWIIGNHSDELTPWIPVIAAKSSHKTKFFLLPCCHFDFDGSKYARNCSKKTCYEEYMDYVELVSETCGFKTEKDRLKIPSTKRISIVGRERYYSECDKIKYEKLIDDFVKSKLNHTETIKLRESKEKVRNCTQLNKDFLNGIVKDVANYILSTVKDSSQWREGEFVNLKDLVLIISSERRQQLKNECGGLQTLLKNHHHIFLVKEGKVKLRKPTPRSIASNIIKKKDCWFFVNHPDSCPLSDEQCSYIHKHIV